MLADSRIGHGNDISPLSGISLSLNLAGIGHRLVGLTLNISV